MPAKPLTEYKTQWRRFGIRPASQQAELPTVSSGWRALDRLLPGAGYPLTGVTELLIPGSGIGELSLLLNMLANRMSTDTHSRIAFVSPPHQLNAPALVQANIDCARLPVIACKNDSERVWCIEQMARSHVFVAFVLWAGGMNTTALRRLQLAAEEARGPVFVYRNIQYASQRSPAALRLIVRCMQGRQQLEVLKCRGPGGARTHGLRMTRDLPWQMHGMSESAPIEAVAASNESNPQQNDGHVARSAFPPLGSR